MKLSHKMPSEKSFGLVFACLFAVYGVWPWLVHGTSPRTWALVVAAACSTAALFAPRLLAPFNYVWFLFGNTLHGIANPVMMAMLYYCAVVPMGLIIKLFGGDLLRLKSDPAAVSYWIRRTPPGPAPKSMSKQF